MIRVLEKRIGKGGEKFTVYEVMHDDKRIFYTLNEEDALRIAIEIKETGMSVLPSGEFITIERDTIDF